MMEKLLNSDYRKKLWEKSSEIIERIKEVLPVSSACVMGSFTTSKTRPADVDLILLLKIQDDEGQEWSVDLVIAPDNTHGQAIKKDAIDWMEEKYGQGNCSIIELTTELGDKT